MKGRRRSRVVHAAITAAVRPLPRRRRLDVRRDSLDMTLDAADFEVARQLHAGVTPLEIRSCSRELRLKGFQQVKRSSSAGAYLLWVRQWMGVTDVVCAMDERSALAYRVPTTQFDAFSPDVVDPEARIWFLAGPFLLVVDELLKQCDAADAADAAGSLEMSTARLAKSGTPQSA